MIKFRLLDTGEFLETKADFNISLSFENSIFDFDSIKLNRSQTFNIPRSDINDYLLKMAHLHALSGEMQRRIIPCELWYSGGVISGELQINEYSGNNKEYSCAFIYGSLLKLKEIKEFGVLSNLHNIITDDLYVQLKISLNNNILDPDPSIPFIQRQYRSGIASRQANRINSDMPIPTVKLTYLNECISSQFNNLIFNFSPEMLNKINRMGIKLATWNTRDPSNKRMGRDSFYYLRENLPEINVLDYIKSLAYYTGTLLIWDEKENTIEFWDVNFNLNEFIDITDRVIQLNSIYRKAGNYSRNNITQTKTDDNNRPFQESNLTVDNDKIINVKTKILPYMSGFQRIFSIQLTTGDGKEYLFCDDYTFGDPDDFYVYTDQRSQIPLMAEILDSGILHTTTLVKNQNLQDILTLSCEVDLTIWGTLFEFMLLSTEKQVIKYDNGYWAIISSNYSNNTIRFKLLKIR